MARHRGPVRLPRPLELLACLVTSTAIAAVVLVAVIGGLSAVGRLPLFPG